MGIRLVNCIAAIAALMLMVAGATVARAQTSSSPPSLTEQCRERTRAQVCTSYSSSDSRQCGKLKEGSAEQKQCQANVGSCRSCRSAFLGCTETITSSPASAPQTPEPCDACLKAYEDCRTRDWQAFQKGRKQ